jgi:hypothetical protein
MSERNSICPECNFEEKSQLEIMSCDVFSDSGTTNNLPCWKHLMDIGCSAAGFTESFIDGAEGVPDSDIDSGRQRHSKAGSIFW